MVPLPVVAPVARPPQTCAPATGCCGSIEVSTVHCELQFVGVMPISVSWSDEPAALITNVCEPDPVNVCGLFETTTAFCSVVKKWSAVHADATTIADATSLLPTIRGSPRRGPASIPVGARPTRGQRAILYSLTTTRRLPAADSGMLSTISIVNGAPGR